MGGRDEFPIATKRTLAIRAAHFCSNPRCRRLTAGPHSDENKSLATGHAAHIHAAAANGPRYDQNQTPAQRRSITNGIWLCRECGDIVDKDGAPHPPDLLRQWKRHHEEMISEVRAQGYSRSLDLLQAGRVEPALAKQIIALLEDRRALWESFDAEFPERVRSSLGFLRVRLTDIRGELIDGSPLDVILLALTKTIHVFFKQVETSDLATLRCNSRDPEWVRFSDALAALRKSVGLQIRNLADAYGIGLSSDLQSIVPTLS
jgi:hypothetical protein